MRELAPQLLDWWRAGTPFAIATVIDVTGSAPREIGATLAVNAAGAAIGSVSGGCVEGSVYELCRDVLRDHQPRHERFGYAPGEPGPGSIAADLAPDPFAVGLTCGGQLDIFVRPSPRGEGRGDGRMPARDDAAPLPVALAAMAAGAPVALATVVAGPPELLGAALAVGATPDPAVDAALANHPELATALTRRAMAMLDRGVSGLVGLGAASDIGCAPERDTAGVGARGAAGVGVSVFVEVSQPPPRLIIFGAVDFAGALARVGRTLGYHVTVCDARGVFATAQRFPDADEVVVDWPHRYLATTATDRRTAICVLTHDPKFDVPALRIALRLPVGYVGAMGSRHTCADRADRLRAAGVTEHELDRLHAPIGLDLGAAVPEETAVAIAAEIIAVRHGGGGRPLRDSAVPIHPATAARMTGDPLTDTTVAGMTLAR